MKKNNLIYLTVIGIVILLSAGQVWAALNLEGQSGVFLNTLAYTLSPDKVEYSSHYVNLDSMGTVSTFNVSMGFKNDIEVGATRISSAVTGVDDQNVFSAKWNFSKETPTKPAVAFTVLYRDLLGSDSSADFGVSATKIFMLDNKPLIVDFGVRSTKAKWQGLQGFSNDRETMLEASAAYFVTKKLAVGAEFKQQPDDLRTWTDIAFRYVVSDDLNIDAGIANMGSTIDNQVAFAITKSW